MRKYKFKEVPMELQYKISMTLRRMLAKTITYRELHWLLEQDSSYGFLDSETKAYIINRIRKVEN